MSGRIAMFLPNLHPGGAERVVLNLAQVFSAEYDVDLLLARNEGAWRILVPPQIALIDLRASRMAMTVSSLCTYLRRRSPDVLMSTCGHANLAAIAAGALAGQCGRVIIREATTPSIYLSGLPRVRRRAMMMATHALYPRARAVIAVSAGAAADLVSNFGVHRRKLVVLPNPVVPDDLSLRVGQTVHEPWLALRDVPLLVTAGRLIPEKDHETLLRAIHIVRSQQRVHLIVLGEGPTRGTIERLIESLDLTACVRLAGFVDNPYPYFSHADLFVLSSRCEGMPGTLIQALACGCPVVSTDCPSGPREVLQGGAFGELVPVGNPEKLAEAIMRSLMQNRPRNLRKVAEPYGTAAAAGHYLSLFRRLRLLH